MERIIHEPPVGRQAHSGQQSRQTNPVSNAGRLVQRALAFIRTHAAEAIKPRDVTTYLKVSRSLADLRFRELQGESIGACILRYRLEEVRRRILATDDTLANIAADCSFSKFARLNQAFKAAYGCSLHDCRARRESRSPGASVAKVKRQRG